MTFVYIMMDIGILFAIVALRVILGKKYKLKRREKINVERSAKKFQNKELYKQAEEQQSDASTIGVYAPAMNDYAFNNSNKTKGYRYKSNPHYEHQLVQREADRMSRRTEAFMIHQAMMNNNHFNNFKGV